VLGGPNCSTCLSLEEIKVNNGEITGVPKIRTLCYGVEASAHSLSAQILIKNDNPFIKCNAPPTTNAPVDTPTATNTPSKSPSDKIETNTFSTPLIIGMLVGGVIILGAIFFGVFKFYQYYQNQKSVVPFQNIQSPSTTPIIDKEDSFSSYSGSED